MWSAASLSTSKRQKLGTHAEDAFGQTAGDDGVLFYLCVIKVWLRQVVLARTLICRSICRGMMEFMRDILGASISEGGVPDLHQLAAQRLGGINQTQDLSQIRVGLHYEILTVTSRCCAIELKMDAAKEDGTSYTLTCQLDKAR